MPHPPTAPRSSSRPPVVFPFRRFVLSSFRPLSARATNVRFSLGSPPPVEQNDPPSRETLEPKFRGRRASTRPPRIPPVSRLLFAFLCVKPSAFFAWKRLFGWEGLRTSDFGLRVGRRSGRPARSESSPYHGSLRCVFHAQGRARLEIAPPKGQPTGRGKARARFPTIGKIQDPFSNHWKNARRAFPLASRRVIC